MASVGSLESRVAAVRSFNRFYTNVIGVLREGLLQTTYSLTEARVLFELGQRDALEASTLRRELELDAGYLSRILRRFQVQGLLTKERSTEDGRRQLIKLTDEGRATFETLDTRSSTEVKTLLADLPEDAQRKLLDAMRTIRETLDPSSAPVSTLREATSGDFGWVIERHGALYEAEYDWDEEFEGLVADIVANYLAKHDPRLEKVWIAELGGERVGCVFCVKKEEKIAQLRLLLVEPTARGYGIGTRLVKECIEFARAAGYDQMMLWTNHVLDDARRIYERFGFELVEENKHHSFGQELIGQNWWLDL